MGPIEWSLSTAQPNVVSFSPQIPSMPRVEGRGTRGARPEAGAGEAWSEKTPRINGRKYMGFTGVFHQSDQIF